ncbi:hypothetical protein B0T14DRAFT_405441, partial [Immersiella caudata]
IEPTAEYLAKMNLLISSLDVLKRHGFIVAELTSEQLDKKKRCKTCNARGTHLFLNSKEKAPEVTAENKTAEGMQAEKEVVMRCKSHPGNFNQTMSCCGKPPGAPGCRQKKDHDPPEGQSEALKTRWQYHHTPTAPQATHRVAVALDCEMGMAIDQELEVIRVTVIDYFTGDKLVDSLVWPDIYIKNCNTRWSGVTKKDMNDARREGKCLLGVAAVREAVFEFVGPETIVVGHAVGGDLGCLRWIHHKIVDTHILEAEKRKKEEEEKKAREEEKAAEQDVEKEAVEEKGEPQSRPGSLASKSKKEAKANGTSLKALTMKHLGRAIQTAGKMGHDSFEDSLASRDLLRHWIINLAE